MAASFYGMIEEVYVMLVDNDEEFVARMVDLLKSYDYKVITVDTASAAKSMLSKGKQKIHVLILNVHSVNQISFDLLAQALILDIISIVVCDEPNELVATKALKEGAYFFLTKPFEEEIMKYLWQFVLTEKKQREKVRKGSGKNRDGMNIEDIGDNIIFRDNVEQSEKYKLKKKRGRKEKEETNEGESQSHAINKVVGQKNYIEWTDDLHSKFMKAVEQLGNGKCYPKEIVELMNVPGLTRMHVASHLQKCRRNSRRSPEERKYIRHPSGQEFTSDSHEIRSSFQKYGTMPRLGNNVPTLQHNTNQIQRGPKFSFPTLSTTNILGGQESFIQQQLFCPQLEVQPHSFINGNSFNNPFYSVPNNMGGGLQEQHGPLFKMLSSQGPMIGSTSYRPGQALNSGPTGEGTVSGSNGDHLTQSDYSLNVNVAQGAKYSDSRMMSGGDIENAIINGYNLKINANNVMTYSSSAMMSGTYIGNASMNQLGAANVNFQQYVGEPNISNPRNIIAASYESDIEEPWTFECQLNEQGTELDQVYSEDQIAETSSVQFSRIENYSDELST